MNNERCRIWEDLEKKVWMVDNLEKGGESVDQEVVEETTPLAVSDLSMHWLERGGISVPRGGVFGD